MEVNTRNQLTSELRPISERQALRKRKPKSAHLCPHRPGMDHCLAWVRRSLARLAHKLSALRSRHPCERYKSFPTPSVSEHDRNSVIMLGRMIHPYKLLLRNAQKALTGGTRNSSTAKVWVNKDTTVICQGFTGTL